MPAHKKKTTTSSSPEAPSTVSSAELLKPETFHQYLRAEIRYATRLVMEEIMREELSGFLSTIKQLFWDHLCLTSRVYPAFVT